jgi:hypothetical protein
LVRAANWAYGPKYNDTYVRFIGAIVEALSALQDLISNQRLLEIALSGQFARVTTWAVEELKKRGDVEAFKRCYSSSNYLISSAARECLKDSDIELINAIRNER